MKQLTSSRQCLGATPASTNETIHNKQLRKSACILAALFLFAGCGANGGTGVDASTSVTPNEPQEVSDLMRTEAFSGTLVVHFDESLVVRPDKALVVASFSGNDALMAPVREVLAQHPQATITRYSAQPEEVVDAKRVELETFTGSTMPDWNSVYRVKVEDPEEAIAVMDELRAQPGVKYVYPQFQDYPLGLANTPDLTGQQGYLNAENVGGLNAKAAWAMGVKGEGVIVVDNEHGMNFGHEDLGLSATDWWDSPDGSYIDQPDCAPGFPEQGATNCQLWIAHGTAVAGIIGAQENNKGVTGFSPKAKFLLASMLDGVSAELSNMTDGVDVQSEQTDNDVEPGSVWVIEVGLPGKYSTGECGDTPQTAYGCVPVELWPDTFAAIQQATAYGVTVVEGGANGSIDLGDPNLYTGSWSFAKNMATEDSGAIMVGASQGANEQKIEFSNCGTRFNAFAWGQGVVTTGYPYGSYAWTGSTPQTPPNSDANSYFINNFGGTSSAAAMVGGSAVLVQSRARESLGHKRYLMPTKMREILVGSGVTQKDTGCNIGKQPRIDQAISSADSFVAQAKAQYPELVNGEPLTQARMIALRQLGVGIVCKKQDPVKSDPICPDELVWPEGEKLAKTYDLDGDGRADLVKFENGMWSIDLSSVGSGDDNYGAWDVELSFPAINGQWVWPYVEDMNSDGRADLVAYDKEHGTFYVALTTTELLNKAVWQGWDWVLDYSSQWHDALNVDPNQAKWSRPVIGNFGNNGSVATDHFADIAIYASDGTVRIDYGSGTKSSFAGYEVTAKLVPDALLAQAPGWAYLPVVGDFSNTKTTEVGFKVPDGLPDEGKMYLYTFNGSSYDLSSNWMETSDHMFGGADQVAFVGPFVNKVGLISIKTNKQKWLLSNAEWTELSEVNPNGIYGDAQCHPLVGDYDGDGFLDRAVMCPDEIRIAYSGSETFKSLRDSTGVRHIALGYEKCGFELPGRAYFGGISYTYEQQLTELYKKMHPGMPPPILMDMVGVCSQP